MNKFLLFSQNDTAQFSLGQGILKQHYTIISKRNTFMPEKPGPSLVKLVSFVQRNAHNRDALVDL